MLGSGEEKEDAVVSIDVTELNDQFPVDHRIKIIDGITDDILINILGDVRNSLRNFCIIFY